MAVSNLETTDIFRGAFYLCMGGDLSGIRLRPKATPGQVRFKTNGRQIATFHFIGPELTRHDKAYVGGHALVNPVQFRQALNHLRDILFEHLREQEACLRASHRQRRYENVERSEDHPRRNRKRAYRTHQEHC